MWISPALIGLESRSCGPFPLEVAKSFSVPPSTDTVTLASLFSLKLQLSQVVQLLCPEGIVHGFGEALIELAESCGVAASVPRTQSVNQETTLVIDTTSRTSGAHFNAGRLGIRFGFGRGPSAPLASQSTKKAIQ